MFHGFIQLALGCADISQAALGLNSPKALFGIFFEQFNVTSRGLVLEFGLVNALGFGRGDMEIFCNLLEEKLGGSRTLLWALLFGDTSEQADQGQQNQTRTQIAR